MNLVIQSALPVAATHLDHLGKLSRSKQRVQISENAWRLTAAQAHDGIAPYCIANRLDYGFVPPERRLADFGLLVMDMDSTLISIECIDEIADMQGLKPQVATITEAAMRGEIAASRCSRGWTKPRCSASTTSAFSSIPAPRPCWPD